MKPKVFMVLGGSYGQLKAIETVRRLGMKVLVLDKNPEAVGRAYADFFEPVDTVDYESVKAVAEKYGIVGSMTISSDIAVPTVCRVNEALGLPVQGYGIADAVTDKGLMRKRFLENKVASPAFFEVTNLDDLYEIRGVLEARFESSPFMVKPSDSSGSRGLTRIDHIKDLPGAYEEALRFSRNGKVVIEEYIDGLEIGAQAFSIGGEMKLFFMHNDTVSPNMIPVGHSMPISMAPDRVDICREECAKALKALGIVNGPSNIDIIVSRDGKPYIIEIGARIGATRLPELVEASTGVDIVELSVRLAAGDEDITLPAAKSIPVAAEMLYFDESGVVSELGDLDEIIRQYKPLAFEHHLREGMHVNRLRSGVDVYGYVMFGGPDVHYCEERCRAFLNEVKYALRFDPRP